MKSICLGLLLLCAVGLFGQTQPLLLGVLEDVPSESANDMHHRAARALFFHEGDDWKAFPTDCENEECLHKLPARYPQAVHWTIAFDGRKMGEVSARTPAEWSSYWRVGEQVILPSAKVPVIGKPTEEFAGFLGDPILRPLVAVSRSNFQAPDNWKPAHISENERAAIRTQFSKHFASVQNCDNESAPRKNWHYADADFHFGKSYGASTTWKLAAVHLSAYRCDGIVDDPSNDPFADQWFTIDPNGETQFLRGNLVLVDAGDYDKSGHSQLLFMIDDYNRSGYVLFYDNFAKQATFEYHFH